MSKMNAYAWRYSALSEDSMMQRSNLFIHLELDSSSSYVFTNLFLVQGEIYSFLGWRNRLG